MRIRATCHACDRDFHFFELRNAGTGMAGRCPNCDRPLGVRGVLAVRAEQALAVLVGSLEELARQDPNFTVRASSVTGPVEKALATLAAPTEEAPSPWWKGRRAA
jgi:hypothetical protein